MQTLGGGAQILDSSRIWPKEKSYQSEIKILNEQIKYLQAQLFGRKSEKKPVESNQGQLSLFEMPEQEFPIGDQLEKDEQIDIPAHKRKKRGRRPIPDNLFVVDLVHDIDDADKVCECGCLKERIGEETSKQLDIIPAKIQVTKHIRPKYACKRCKIYPLGVELHCNARNIVRFEWKKGVYF